MLGILSYKKDKWYVDSIHGDTYPALDQSIKLSREYNGKFNPNIKLGCEFVIKSDRYGIVIYADIKEFVSMDVIREKKLNDILS